MAAGRMSPCNMEEGLLLPSHLDDLNPLRHFDPVLDVTDTETIPIPNLDNIEPEKLSLGEKLPLDEEMEVVVKPDNELDMLATPADLTDSCSLPSFSVMDRHLSEPKAPTPSYYQHRNSYITPPKVSGKRKLTGKIKVCILTLKKFNSNSHLYWRVATFIVKKSTVPIFTCFTDFVSFVEFVSFSSQRQVELLHVRSQNMVNQVVHPTN